MSIDRRIPSRLRVGTAARPVASRTVEIEWLNLGSALKAFARTDLRKVLRFAAVSVVTVPLGMTLFWFFLQTDMAPVLANLIAVAISTIPNYLLNRYWVWNKRGRNSVSREIAPFWAMAFLGLAMSTLFVWVVGLFTDASPIFLAANFVAFGLVWVLKFFVIERYLFGSADVEVARSTS